MIKMVVNKRKKNSRQRGSKTHGWGSMKKHRGAGNRGGRGMAGTGKRGDAKKPSIWKTKYFGKFGFKKKGIKTDVKAINIVELEERLGHLLSKNLISKENDLFIVDLLKLGYNKLLGKGKPVNKLRITAEYASEGSINKIKSKGGEVIITSKKEEPEQPKKQG